MLKYDVKDKAKCKLGYIDDKKGVHYFKINGQVYRPEDKKLVLSRSQNEIAGS